MAQLLKKFDDVLLASMKKANNNPIPNTIRINGVLLQGCTSNYNYERYISLMQNNYSSFNPDGTKVYFTRHNTGVGSGTGYDPIIMYNLGTAWDVSTIIANGFQVAASGTYAIPAAVSINTDTVVSSAQGHCFSPDGTKIFVCNSTTGVLRKFTVSTPWDITTMSLSTSATTYGASLSVVKFTPDGLTMVLLGTGGLKKYTLNSAWDIIGGTLISTAASGFASDFDFQNNGSYVFTFNGSNLIRYTLSSPYNITGITATQTLNLTGGPYIGSTPVIVFKDGFKGFISSYNGNAPCIISAFNLTCSFDISNPLIVPTPTPTPTPTQTPGASPSQTPTQTPTKTVTPTLTPTNTQTPTITPTQTPTRTQTPTPSSYPVLPTCSVLYNDDNANVFYYNVSANTSTQLTVIGFPFGPSIAHTSNKLWGSNSGTSAFTEYNISLPSFVATFSRNISFPSGYKPSKGLAAISDTVILAVNTNTTPHQVVEINVSGTSIMTTKFSLMSNREITGDFYKTTTNKFLALTTDTTTLNAYLTQWDYLTGTLEVDSQLSLSVLDSLDTWGIFQYNNNIYITSTANGITPQVSKTYIVNKDSPYNLTYSVTTQKLIVDASQIPSCLTTNLNAPSPYLCSLNDVNISGQTWTSCNLNVATYRDGTVIPQVTSAAIWSGLTTGAWCFYNNNSTIGNTYGKLYNWYAVAGIDGSGTPRTLAPAGYHIPTDTEWTTLINNLGGVFDSGGALKETGTTHWSSPNEGATNSVGFTGLPGSYRNDSGDFYTLGTIGQWWTSTGKDTLTAWNNYIVFDTGGSTRGFNKKTNGMSVRLISDSSTPTPTPTQTPTPTITPTHTPTPTITPTVTPTRAPIVVNADYLVFTYTFPTTSGVDLDTLTYLYVNNVTGTTYANVYNPIGFCSPIRFTCTPQPNCTIPSGKWGGPNLWWGGDNINTGGTESVYVDIKQLKLSGSVTTIQLNCRANWYRDTPNTGTGIVKIQMQAFSGGTMISDGNYGFTNAGGVLKATYTFSDSTILASNSQCAGTDCVGFFTYTLSTGTFVKSNTCIP